MPGDVYSTPKYLFDDVPAPGELWEVAKGVMWLRMPLPMALDHINLYLLEEDDGWWIIDTGIAIGPTQALWEQIFAESLGGKPVKAVLSTHYHPDHVGMAGWLCERWQAPFYMTQAEYLSGLAFSRMQPEHFSWSSERYLRAMRRNRLRGRASASTVSETISNPCPPLTAAW